MQHQEPPEDMAVPWVLVVTFRPNWNGHTARTCLSSAQVRQAVGKRDGRNPELGLRPGRFLPGATRGLSWLMGGGVGWGQPETVLRNGGGGGRGEVGGAAFWGCKEGKREVFTSTPPGSADPPSQAVELETLRCDIALQNQPLHVVLVGFACLDTVYQDLEDKKPSVRNS